MKFKKVLIIDDDEVDTYVSKRIIREHAFAEAVVSASSVKEAMDYLRQNSGPGHFPDFIFLDLNMPGQSGLDFLEEYQSFAKEKKVSASIALLMNVVNAADQQTLNAKAHPLVKYVFEKPLTLEKLKSI